MIWISFSSSKRKYPCVSSRSLISVPAPAQVRSFDRFVFLPKWSGVGAAVTRLGRNERIPLRIQSLHRLAAFFETVVLSNVVSRNPVASFQVAVQQLMQRAVELGPVGPLEHHREIVAFLPMILLPQIALHHLMETCPWQRIAHAHPDIVGQALPHHTHGLHNFADGFAGISELNKEACANSRAPELFANHRN